MDEPVPNTMAGAATSFADEPPVPYDRWRQDIAALRNQFQSNQPIPHIVLKNFLEPSFAEEVERAFPLPNSSEWIHYKHYNEITLGFTNRNLVAPPIRRLLDEFVSDRFASFVSELTGISDLHGDPSLEGGGLHITEAGGFLRVHTDFTHHHYKPSWRRSCNLILYLNHDWKEEWGGSLELWDKSLTQCVHQYPPLFNHALFFATVEHAYHGYPHPITPPAGIARKSITSYYYTLETGEKTPAQSTHYVVRPGEGGNKYLVQLDNLLLKIYSRLKRTIGLSDRWTRIFRHKSKH